MTLCFAYFVFSLSRVKKKKVNPELSVVWWLTWKYNGGICLLAYSVWKIRAGDTNRHLIYFINDLFRVVCFALWIFLSVTCVCCVELESFLLCNISDDRLLL